MSEKELKTIVFFHSANDAGREVERFLKEKNDALLKRGFNVATVFSPGDLYPYILLGDIGYEGVGRIKGFIISRL